jgi:hypothetical protein
MAVAEEWAAWLRESAADLVYGEVSVALVICDGQVVRIRKAVEESRRLEPQRRGS